MPTSFLSRLFAGRATRVQRVLAGARQEFERGYFESALGIARQALRHDPRSAAAHALAGACSIELARAEQHDAVRRRAAVPDVSGTYDRAIAHFEECAHYSADPCKPIGRQAAALREAGRLDASHALLERARTRCSANPDYLLELAQDCLCLGDSGRARSVYEDMLAIAPADPRVHAAYALALLGDGEFGRGWDEYEWRLQLAEFAPRHSRQAPRWQGEPVAGRTLFAEAEQGLGDQIMFASCVPELLAGGAHVLLEASPRLAKLFEHSFPTATVLPKSGAGRDWTSLPAVDWHVPIGSLPCYMRRSMQAFPDRCNYLKAPPELVDLYRGRLALLGNGPKVGIAWHGGLPGTLSALRSLRLDDLDPLLQLGHLKFVSLEFADCRAEIEAARGRGVGVSWWPEAALDMAHFAALISALDCVVSVATTAVHMAGALGKPTWALVARGGTWRYMWQGEKMPWYPAVRVLRPAQSGGWSAQVEEIARALTEQ